MAADLELGELDAFADLTVPVEVRIGKCVMKVEEIAGLQCGASVPLDRLAGETLELLVGNVHLGMVEVVVNEDRLTVRVTEFFLPDIRTAAAAA